MSILTRIGSIGRKAVPGVALAIVLATPVSGQYRATAITNVNIVPMDRETVLENMTIVVRNGVIESLTPTGDAHIPANATVIDADGKYLLPGLTDMHVHVRTADALKLYVANGFTTVRNMNGRLGDPLGWRAAVQRGDIVGPRLITAAPTMLLRGFGTGYPAPATAEEERDALDHAHAGIVSLEHMWEVAAAIGDHPDGLNRLREKARELQISGTAIATLLMSNINYDELWVGRESFFKGKHVEPLDRSLVLETLRIFNEEHVDVVIGTDLHGPLEIAGLSAFDEMDLFVEAGLKPYDALRAATITPAKVLGKLERSGTIAVGKNADFVLVDGNPLENLDVLRKPSGVMAQGRWLDRDELRYILAEAIESVTWCRDRC